MNRANTDRYLLILSVTGLVLLSFIGGGLTVYSSPRVRSFLDDAFEAKHALRERDALIKKPPIDEAALKDTIAHADVQWNRDEAYNGYTLFTISDLSEAFLIDMAGKTVYKWALPFSHAFPHPPQVKDPLADRKIHWEIAKVFPNGDLLAVYVAYGDSPFGYGMVKMDRDSKVLWTYASNTHHDVYIAGDKNIYVLTHAFVHEPVKDFEDIHYPILTDTVAILSPDGRELRTIPILDAFSGTAFQGMVTRKESAQDKKWYRPDAKPWDYLHANTVMKLEPELAGKFPQFKAGDILVSLRNFHAIAVIDPDTCKVVWAAQGPWQGQHAAQFLDNGHILLFDNQGKRDTEGEYSSILEIDPQPDPNTIKVAWSYAGNGKPRFYSRRGGRVQRLPNGNTLVDETENERLFEITPQGKVVWQYSIPHLQKAGGPAATMSATRYTSAQLPFLNHNEQGMQ